MHLPGSMVLLRDGFNVNGPSLEFNSHKIASPPGCDVTNGPCGRNRASKALGHTSLAGGGDFDKSRT